jgi:hypothetical protein
LSRRERWRWPQLVPTSQHSTIREQTTVFNAIVVLASFVFQNYSAGIFRVFTEVLIRPFTDSNLLVKIYSWHLACRTVLVAEINNVNNPTKKTKNKKGTCWEDQCCWENNRVGCIWWKP